MKQERDFYIDGKWVRGDDYPALEVENPATKEIIGVISQADKKIVDAGVRAAKNASESWRKTKVEERIKYMEAFVSLYRENIELLRDTVIREFGVARESTRSQVELPLVETEKMMQAAMEFSYREKLENAVVTYEPYGVVACISPWNYPILQITRKIVPALLAGNTVVLKPASSTPLSAVLITQLLHEAGFPKGVINLVQGKGSLTGEMLATHPQVDVLSFTGSTEVGERMYEYAKKGIKHLILELGGKSPAIILPGADIKNALRTVMNTCFSNVGQTCSALTRLVVVKEILEETKEALKEIYQEFPYGDPESKGIKVGPVHSLDQYEKVRSYIEIGVKEGATLFLGEVPPKESKSGYYISPIVFTDVKNSMRIAREEIFGPVLSVIEAQDAKEALALANDTDYGLSSAVFGELEEALKIAEDLQAGNVSVNGTYGKGDAPFGGFKQSGIGRENGSYGLREYLQAKAVFYHG